jgi:hypothetical protein
MPATRGGPAIAPLAILSDVGTVLPKDGPIRLCDRLGVALSRQLTLQSLSLLLGRSSQAVVHPFIHLRTILDVWNMHWHQELTICWACVFIINMHSDMCMPLSGASSEHILKNINHAELCHRLPSRVALTIYVAQCFKQVHLKSIASVLGPFNSPVS